MWNISKEIVQNIIIISKVCSFFSNLNILILGGNRGQRTNMPALERPAQYPDQRNTGFSRGGYRGGYRGSDRQVFSQEAGGFRGRGRGNYENQSYRGRDTPYGNRGGNFGAPRVCF